MFKRRWWRMSIDQKVQSFAAIIAVIILVSAGFSMFTMSYSLRDYGQLLDENRASQTFMEAMEAEGTAFSDYASTRTESAKENLQQAIQRTERAIDALPFSYELIGQERYARTWNIKNAYQQYAALRDRMLSGELSRTEFLRRLNEYNQREAYLEQYSRRLLQLTVEAGSRAYTEKLPLFRALPFIFVNFTLIMLVIVMQMGNLMKDSIAKPVRELSQEAQRIAESDFSGEDIQVESQDELGGLVTVFNDMKHAMAENIETIQENHRMTELLQQEKLENSEMEKRLNANRLELLKSQINPHFLFNTLNMIGSMANLEDALTTEKMTQALAQLFRYNLNTQEQIVPIDMELRIAENYMYLQKMRFGSRIRYEVQVPESIEHIRIPSFTMQPLVENAIVHGLSKKEQGGTVRVTVQQDPETRLLTLTIEDDGLGMEEDRLAALNARMHQPDENKTARIGIGLGNIYRRIRTLYPEGGDLRIDAKKDVGTRIILTIPQEEKMRTVSAAVEERTVSGRHIAPGTMEAKKQTSDES